MARTREAAEPDAQVAERLARIIELLPAAAVHVRAGVLSMNAAMEAVTGYARAELPTLEAWFEKLYGDTSGKLLARYLDQRAQGFPATVEGSIRRKDGEVRRIEFRACNDEVGEICIVNDITERDAIQQEMIAAKDRAEAGARSKAEFLANMSHELRTPLTAIIGFAELLAREGALGPQERHWLARIDDASKTLHAIVNDVLDFSKLEEGAIELEKRPSATQRGRSFSKSPGRGLQTSARTKSDGNGLGRPWLSRKGRVATCRGSRRGEPVWIPIMGCLKANINHPPGSRREKLRRPLHQPCLGRRRIRRSDRLPGWPHGVCRLRGTTQPEPARRAEMQSPPYPAARQPQKATACGPG